MYHLTYVSDGLRVKGYICLPHGWRLPVSAVQEWLQHHYRMKDLEVTELACPTHVTCTEVPEGKWPVLIYCRGGIGRVGQVKTTWLEDFSIHGHIIFAPSYRGTEGGEGRDQFGGSDIEDVCSAYQFLAGLPFVDERRISVMGFSRGSINATAAAVRMKQMYKLVLWGGVSDLAQTYEERIDLRRMLKRVIGGSTGKIPEAYDMRSPVTYVYDIHCPVLIMHGTEDVQVDYSHGLSMFRRLQEAGKDVTFHTFHGYGHHLPPAVHALAIQNMFAWLQKPVP